MRGAKIAAAFAPIACVVTALFFPSTVARAGTPELQPPMGAPLSGLTTEQLDRFEKGAVAFNRVFTEGEGLGPIHNQNSCGSCHSSPLGGSSGITATRAIAETKEGFDNLTDFGGPLFQNLAINEDCQEVVPPQATRVIVRTSPSTLGFGLVEAIPDADILFHEANPPSANVSGRTHMAEPFEDPGNLRAGRFGWKAGVPTVLTFSADATLNEMGITNRFILTENDPNGINPPELGPPDNCDTVPDPEDVADAEGVEFIDRVTDFQRFLAPPPQTPKSGMTGEALFNAIGCADCHVTSFTTSNDAGLEPALQNKTLQPYSDFLLHNMGANADFIPEGDAGPDEIRTTPLWGVRIRDPLWHDGRFVGGFFEQRARDAIAAHSAPGSEASFAGDAFAALNPADQDAVIAFLDSLGRREFDHDGNNVIDENDLAAHIDCFTGPGNFYTPDDPCSISDVDQDGDVDFSDTLNLLAVFEGPLQDCNDNGCQDVLDIFLGESADCDANLIPDECEICGDLDNDLDVDGDDFTIFLLAFGTTDGDANFESCADFVADTTVNFPDFQVWLNCYRDFIGNPVAQPPAPTDLGDIDANGIVNALDVQRFVEILTNTPSVTFREEFVADINQDGTRSLADIQPFADLLVGE